MTFYLKYRPQNLSDLDIKSVRESLESIVKSDKIPHALLFAGTKGTGKTSAARIIAKVLNCEKNDKLKEPCNKCAQCISITNGTNIDVIELDAASNRGIDDIRVLRDGVKLAPARAKKKVYIIDEAHMLTTEASNALLKTLEEPPNHVYFILATTNSEKIIDTIKSRTLLVKFNKATKIEVVTALSKIVKEEKIKISEGDLEKIYQLSKGSFRDAVKVLENYSLEGKMSDTSELDSLTVIKLIENKDKKKILEKAPEINLEDLLSKLNQELLATEGIGERLSKFDKKDLIRLIELLITASEQSRYSPIEELPLELAIIKYLGNDNDQNITDKNNNNVSEKKKIDKTEKEEAEPFEKETEVAKVVEVRINESNVADNDWDKILKAVRPINASIEALLRASKPIGFDGNNLRLGVYYKFHKERLDEIRNKKILEDAIAGVFNNPIKVDCLLTEIPKEVVKKVDLIEPQINGTHPDISKVAEEIFS